MSFSVRRSLLLIVVASAAALWHLVDPVGSQTASDSDRPGAASEAAQEGTYHRPTGGPVNLRKLLAKVEVVAERPSVAGYDRDCGTGHGCSFGQSWSDDVGVEFGHNGCDTRNDLLRASMDDLHLREGTHGCVVEAGHFTDPYTGRDLQFRKSRAHEVQVDHVYPLARAWDLGAHQWPLEQRVNFANDPRNLLVVDGSANASKSDQGPGEWLPVNRAYRCRYVARYLKVAATYELPITQTDRDAARALAPHCSSRGGRR